MAYEKVVQKFGLRLAKLRNESGLTQEELAFKAGVDRTYISLLERGLRNPTLKRLWKISRVLKMSLPDLVKF
ncbi:MAG: hypothetical protein A3A51_00030 [Candidatus Levybacteria bacterium RIFCSPLOWO2_01_FULL_39_10]|nr:MAG: hypothetical protein A3A51_00030 [Candidatus Levybacteria bacterium RIFCSPLOWO2_01_FULL_39_10]